MSSPDGPALRQALIGTWALMLEELRDLDGTPLPEQRPPSQGFITYTPDGYVFWMRADLHRPVFAQPDFQRATREEKAQAAESFRAYAGTFALEGRTVVHHVAFSLFPNWTGAQLKRSLLLADDRLELTSSPFTENGRTVVGVLGFRRADRYS